MPHHTKAKADIGLTAVVADLVKHGFGVALPISDHLPFDLIAAAPVSNALLRTQVKYRAATRGGSLEVEMTTTWNNSRGTHKRLYGADDFELLAVYCPDTQACYYLRRSEIAARSICLRITESPWRNGKPHRLAADFADPRRVLGDDPAGSGALLERV
jgi:hypothetical protein